MVGVELDELFSTMPRVGVFMEIMNIDVVPSS